MNDDFEEDYEDDDSDILEDAKDIYDDIKDIKDKYKNKNKVQESNSSNPQKEAQNFDKQLRDKNIARSQKPELASTGGTTAGGATAGTAAAGTAAAGGEVAAQAAIPVAGWIALGVEAIIALAISGKKALKKHDEKMAENGVDSKGLRKLLKASPILLPIAIIVLIIILLVQGETQDKVEFMNQAVKCFESQNGCVDFMNTGIKISR